MTPGLGHFSPKVDTKSMNTPRTTTIHDGAFILYTQDGIPAMLTDHYTQDDQGVWGWIGLFPNGYAEKLTPGYIIRDWAFFLGTEQPGTRGDWLVVKVNRVTIVVQQVVEGIAEGPVHVVRIAN